MKIAPWDVAIIGGGPAGCATALALAKRGVSRICIVDATHETSVRRIGESIPPDTRLLLDDLQGWEAFVADRHEPCLGSCAAWGSDVLGYNDFVLNAHGPGWHLDRAVFERRLRELAQARNVEIFRETRLVDVKFDAPAVNTLCLELLSGGVQKIEARYVVDATGARAAVARRAGTLPKVLDRLVFVYGFFDAAAGASGSQLTIAETAPDGWWYAAGVPGRELVVAFATDPEQAREAQIASEHCWLGRVLRTRHVAARLDGCRFRRGSLLVRAAPVSRLDCAAGRRWLAVGDAAAAYDPLSSQGIYKALADGLRAAAALTEALSADSDIPPEYARVTLDEFEEHRVSRNHFYGLETRWAASPFWHRRTAARDFSSEPKGGRTTLQPSQAQGVSA